MSNPVLVEVLRGALVESRHSGAVAVVDADGGRVLALGDVEQPVYPRSAVKALQALPLIESGAADRFGLGPEELALACASHSGEPEHVATATRMLARAGLDASALECGAHWPIHQPSAQALARAGGTARRYPQQLLGQARGLSVRGLRDRTLRPRALCRGRTSGAAPGQGDARRCDRRGAVAGCLRHRRLLGPDLGDAAGGAGAGLCPLRHRRWASRPDAPRRRRACARPAPRSPGTSRAPAGSAPRSCSASARACS